MFAPFTLMRELGEEVQFGNLLPKISLIDTFSEYTFVCFFKFSEGELRRHEFLDECGISDARTYACECCSKNLVMIIGKLVCF